MSLCKPYALVWFLAPVFEATVISMVAIVPHWICSFFSTHQTLEHESNMIHELFDLIENWSNRSSTCTSIDFTSEALRIDQKLATPLISIVFEQSRLKSIKNATFVHNRRIPQNEKNERRKHQNERRKHRDERRKRRMSVENTRMSVENTWMSVENLR